MFDGDVKRVWMKEVDGKFWECEKVAILNRMVQESYYGSKILKEGRELAW